MRLGVVSREGKESGLEREEREVEGGGRDDGRVGGTGESVYTKESSIDFEVELDSVCSRVYRER